MSVMSRRLVCLVFLALLAACSRQAVFVVLPNPNGTAGAITIDDGKNSVLLDKPYAAGEVRGGTAEPTSVTPADVQQIFGQALKARPIPPRHFILYFISDSDTLTPPSQRAYHDVFDDIKKRPVYQVEVIGHTDTLGDETYNQQLSLSRARAIRDHLVTDGLSRDAISVAGRGDLDLAVKTASQVSEPRNRRVEITVR
jgi:outer membrane protein OmpA-like peptidoglycan-associated protein